MDHNNAPKDAQLTYCFCDFHPACTAGVEVIQIGGVGYVWCGVCHRLGHIDLVGHRVSIEECKNP